LELLPISPWRLYQTKSSSDGRFRFAVVPRGAYDLEFAEEGFIRRKVSVDLSREAAQPLAIVLNFGSLPDMNYCGPHPSIAYDSLELKNPRLTGVVRAYENHGPIARAEVVLWREHDAHITATSVADAEVRFKFDSLPAGRYRLRISRIGYLPVIYRVTNNPAMIRGLVVKSIVVVLAGAVALVMQYRFIFEHSPPWASSAATT
jgi:hypothetical protein